ncbi:MAG: HAD-IIIC family phosphatase [Ruminiclostridium sp.]|nr:HAD-IIIC family phosphatase [Ruminiclostridium sp.]
MSEIFEYPFDAAEIMRKSKKLKRELLEDGTSRVKKRIAILGGSTVDAIADVTELFLLDAGIEPEFYISEYAQYYNDAVYPPEELLAFKPDVVYFCTSYRTLTEFPRTSDTADEVNAKLDAQFTHFTEAWESVTEKLKCPIIQNNFELPPFRLLGNSGFADIHGRVNYINRLNARFAEYAGAHTGFYICDINYVSACYGLDEWHDGTQWYMYKYALPMNAVPAYASNLAAIIKAMYGKSRKVLALDLDNTLWGGVVGDDGAENLQIGRDLPGGQVYSEFQEYVKLHKDIGVLLTVCSKNDLGIAMTGLEHPDGTLRPDDFTVIKANWENKDENLLRTAEELSLLPESFVFADDNPAERQIVRDRVKGAAVPEMEGAENYIRILDRGRYFEVLHLSEDDLRRGEMYRANAARAAAQHSIADYGEYLDSLEMKAEINTFIPMYIARIAQLTNKSNQFNVTTRRYSEAEIANISHDVSYIPLYGRLSDKFGDNGVVSVVIGNIRGAELHIDLWIMSCRVLKRDMEYAMLDELVRRAKEKGITEIYGYYYPTAKNAMVRELFDRFGFEKISSDEAGNTKWRLIIDNYNEKNTHISVN